MTWSPCHARGEEATEGLLAPEEREKTRSGPCSPEGLALEGMLPWCGEGGSLTAPGGLTSPWPCFRPRPHLAHPSPPRVTAPHSWARDLSSPH